MPNLALDGTDTDPYHADTYTYDSTAVRITTAWTEEPAGKMADMMDLSLDDIAAKSSHGKSPKITG